MLCHGRAGEARPTDDFIAVDDVGESSTAKLRTNSSRSLRSGLAEKSRHAGRGYGESGNSVATIPAIMSADVNPAGESGVQASVPGGIERPAWKSRLIFPGPPLLLSMDCSSASLSSLASSLRFTVFVLH